MAVKTFTTGEVLTASDTNTYLANAGLVYVGGAAFGGATSGTFDNVFTTTYDSYRIVISNAQGVSQLNSWYMRFLDTNGTPLTTSYYSTSYGQDFASGTTGFLTFSTTIGVYLGPIANASGSGVVLDVYNPRLSATTAVSGQYTTVYSGSQFSGGTIYGWYTATTAMRGFAIYNNAATALTGTVRIYGYRQA
jgi:hypothetical protein